MIQVAGSTPYSWPFAGGVRPASAALVVCGAGGAWSRRTELDAAVERNIAELRTAARAAGAFVVLLDEEPPRERAPFALPADPSPELAPEAGDIRITSAGTDGFYGSALDATLHRRGVEQLVVVGRGFEGAVHSTLRRANDRGYECLTVADACAAIDPDNRAAAVSSIEMSGGIFGAVASTQAVVDAFASAARITPAHAARSATSPPT
jgi:nicotinamidase-related amidase